LEKDETLGYNLSTHGDIEEISFLTYEKEVLFFPFSSFEIKKIEEVKFKTEKIFEIRLLYLGKYLKEIENDKELINKTTNLPESEFKNQIIKFGLIKPEKIEKINVKSLYNSYKKYEKEINQTNKKKNIEPESNELKDQL
jgi:membrane protein CcdC involved in cytochrome C biogenesis